MDSSTTVESDEKLLQRRHYPVLQQHTTRWADNDMYGHLNNAVYYQLFDAAINGWIIANTGVYATRTDTLGVVAESGCRYFRELEFPEPITVGIRIRRLGRSSVTYDLGLFSGAPGAEDVIAARGHWVHVYIDAASRTPVPIPDSIREVLQGAVVEGFIA